MEKLLTNLQLFLLVITGLLRDVSEVCEEVEYNKQENSVAIKTLTNCFMNIVLVNLRNMADNLYVTIEDFKYIKMKVLSETHNRFLDINYIECMRC